MVRSLEARGGSTGGTRTEPGPMPVEELSQFLDRRGLAVLDVASAAVPGCRRLLLGEPTQDTPHFVVSLAYTREAAAAVDSEHEVLLSLHARLRGELRETVPTVVGRIRVGTDQVGLTVSAVPGLSAIRGGSAGSPQRAQLHTASRWLFELWQDTAVGRCGTDLGRAAATSLGHRYQGTERLTSAHQAVDRALGRVSEHQVPCTVGHGCLCTRHVYTDGESVRGVDDWSRGSLATDPLRDLGHLVCDFSGARLPEVVAGTTSYAGALRSVLRSGLHELGLPRSLWRDVLILAQVELAIEALDTGTTEGVTRLLAAVTALPTERNRRKDQTA